jgi:hypothetical protein
LLLSKSDSAWSLRGYDNLNNLQTLTHIHTQIKRNFCNAFALHFGHQRIDDVLDSQLKFDNPKHTKKSS